MRGIWIRRLLPASVVSLVLVFSYFAPAFGLNVAPVKSHDNSNCGRWGYGYHGGKNNFTCPSPQAPPVKQPAFVQAPPAVKTQAPVSQQSNPANPPAPAPATVPAPAPVTVPATKTVIDVPVSTGVNQWRGFIELVLRQLSKSS